MKTRSFRRRNFFLPSGSLTLGAAALALAVVVVIVRLIAPGVLASAASPLWKLGAAASSATTGISESFGNTAALAGERDRLREENTALTLENAALVQKAADLTRLLGGRASASGGILASVLARPPFAPYDTLVLDAGSAEGITEGALVTGNGGVPLGTVTSVTSASSRVGLFSSPGIETAGWIGENHILITLTGSGAGSYSAALPSTTVVAVGDLVFVPGAGPLPIASVAKLVADPSSAFTVLELRPLVNPFSIVWVEVAPHSFK